LSLEPADALERFRDREPGTLQEQLARQKRAVELALGENALSGHRPKLRPVGDERRTRPVATCLTKSPSVGYETLGWAIVPDARATASKHGGSGGRRRGC
jgi:hypothetical protein